MSRGKWNPATSEGKYCGACRQTKPAEAFAKSARTKDGLQSHCRVCKAAQEKKWRAEKRAENKPTGNNRPDYSRQWWARVYADQQSIDRYNARRRAANGRLKRDVVTAYGGRCACCGETTPEFLTIDHIYNDGKKHRKEVGGSGTKLYQWLRKHGYPKDRYRLLCFNCNCARSLFGLCPHERARERAGVAA